MWGRMKSLKMVFFILDNKPLIVNVWTPDMEFSKIELSTVPLWIRFPRLEFMYLGAKGLSKIGSLIGKPLMVDKNTEKKVGLQFARMLVEVTVGDQFPEEIYFRNENGEVIEQRVAYD